MRRVGGKWSQKERRWKTTAKKAHSSNCLSQVHLRLRQHCLVLWFMPTRKFYPTYPYFSILLFDILSFDNIYCIHQILFNKKNACLKEKKKEIQKKSVYRKVHFYRKEAEILPIGYSNRFTFSYREESKWADAFVKRNFKGERKNQDVSVVSSYFLAECIEAGVSEGIFLTNFPFSTCIPHLTTVIYR